MMRMTNAGMCLLAAAVLTAGVAHGQLTGAGVPAGAELRRGAARQVPQQEPEATRLQQPQLEVQQLPPEARLEQQQLEPALRQQEALQQPGELRRQQLLPPPADVAVTPETTMRGELGVFTVPSPGPGVEITRVTAGSAAEQAGLQPGDVILQIDDRGVVSPMEVQRLIRQMPAGQSATLQVWRDGVTQELAVTLGPAREPYAVGFRPEAVATTAGALEQRTMRLEQQLEMVVQELRMLREQMTQLQTQPVEQPAPLEAPPAREPAEEPAVPEFDLFDEAPPLEESPPESEETPAEQPAEEAEQPAEEAEEQPEDDALFDF